MIRADNNLHDRNMLMLAHHAIWTLSPHVKKGSNITPRDLWPDPSNPRNTMIERLRSQPALVDLYDYGLIDA